MTIRLPEAGKYDFQIKAMNQKFEIEQVPATHSFYYIGKQEEVGEEIMPVEDSDWTIPEQRVKPIQKKLPLHAEREPAKGLFGCALHSTHHGGVSLNFAQTVMGLLFLGLLLFFWRRDLNL